MRSATLPPPGTRPLSFELFRINRINAAEN
jgi:hypothetical protein